MRTPSKAGLARPAARAVNRAEIVERNFVEFLQSWDADGPAAGSPAAPVQPGKSLDGTTLLRLFEAQMTSRVIDLVAREMRSRNEGFYTIGSAGHEANAVLGEITRITDPAFLHYRSGGFMMARSAKGGVDGVLDTALSLAASRDDPISGGRHKVWGSKPLWVLPQTSTIASHLPKAVGTAIALEQARRLHRETPVPPDSIVLCSFGDASLNHSVAQGAINAALWTSHQQLPVPILFVCEDNGLGISVSTPGGWVESCVASRPGLRYFRADGLDVVEAYEEARAAVEYCRNRRRPVFLHLKVVRLLGHAGTDVETDYRPLAEVEAAEARDPLLFTAETILESGLRTAPDLLRDYAAAQDRVRSAAREAGSRARLGNSAEVMSPLAPLRAAEVDREATRDDYRARRLDVFGGEAALPERAPPRHLSIQLNRALHDLLAKYPEMTLFGEDVAQKGGVYTVTSGLRAVFGGNRVFNTLLDETTILGMAQGAGYMGLLPVPEIQYLAYFHNACDQVRGEACSLQFFSAGQFANPMLIRIASLGYQRGFGGHFHNDNSITALRDIPSLIIACPSRGDDAAMMLRSAAALARVDGRVVAFLEPIALYMTKDLHAPGDGQWLFPYPEPCRSVPLGEGRVYNPQGKHLLIVTYGNGVLLSLRAARRLEARYGNGIRILDLRWLKPLNRELIARHATEVKKVLVVDEGRRSGGISEEIFTLLEEMLAEPVTMQRVVGEDSYIPLGAAANLVLPSVEQVEAAASALLARG